MVSSGETIFRGSKNKRRESATYMSSSAPHSPRRRPPIDTMGPVDSCESDGFFFSLPNIGPARPLGMLIFLIRNHLRIHPLILEDWIGRGPRLSEEDRFLRKREARGKARKRKRGPYRKSSTGRIVRY